MAGDVLETKRQRVSLWYYELSELIELIDVARKLQGVIDQHVDNGLNWELIAAIRRKAVEKVWVIHQRLEETGELPKNA